MLLLTATPWCSASDQFMGIEVGMTFSEIEDRLGKPDWGPTVGKDNLYNMEYHLEGTNGTCGIYLSFSAHELDGPTIHAFVKLKTEQGRSSKAWAIQKRETESVGPTATNVHLPNFWLHVMQ